MGSFLVILQRVLNKNNRIGGSIKGDGTEPLGSLMYRSLIEKMHISQKVGEFWKWQNIRIPKIPLASILSDFLAILERLA